MTVIETFTENTFQSICDQLAHTDPDLAKVIDAYGYPPMWSRPNTFESLVWIILEQQVSLASAKAALVKLQTYIGHVTPQSVLKLTDPELKACYFSRQKTIYIRGLASAIASGELKLAKLEALSDEDVTSALTSLKGIGEWTAHIYLIFVLHRGDIFPYGDLAAVNALKKLKQLPSSSKREIIEPYVFGWHPHRTIATMILWHYYLSERSKEAS